MLAHFMLRFYSGMARVAFGSSPLESATRLRYCGARAHQSSAFHRSPGQRTVVWRL